MNGGSVTFAADRSVFHPSASRPSSAELWAIDFRLLLSVGRRPMPNELSGVGLS